LLCRRAPWYEAWSVVLMIAVLRALGVVVRRFLDRGTQATTD